MTIKELIEILKECNQDAAAVIMADKGHFYYVKKEHILEYHDHEVDGSEEGLKTDPDADDPDEKYREVVPLWSDETYDF